MAMWCLVCSSNVIVKSLFYVWNCVTMWYKCFCFVVFQDVVSIHPDSSGDGDLSVLGHVSHRLICTPDFDSLLQAKQAWYHPSKGGANRPDTTPVRGEANKPDTTPARGGWTENWYQLSEGRWIAACVWFSCVEIIEMNLVYWTTLCMDHLCGEHWW